MNGHQALLTMRRAGQVPGLIFVDDDDEEMTRELASTWTANGYRGVFLPHVRIEARDIPEALDLRFVVGLRVHVYCSRGLMRQKRLFRALIEAKASMILANHDGQLWHYEAKK